MSDTPIYRAWNFDQSIGVNTHIDYLNTGSGYADPAVVDSSLGFLGVMHVRDGIPYAGFTLPLYAAIAAAGIKFDILPSIPTMNIASDLSQINQLVQLVPGSVAAIEGANEFNINQYTFDGVGSYNDPAWVQLYGPALYAAVEADPLLTGATVIAPSMANFSVAQLQQEGNLSAFVNSSNSHIYYSDGQQPGQLVAYEVALAKSTAPAAPVTITETGYDTAIDSGGVSPSVQAIETVNALFDAFNDGAQTTYLYELMDEASNPSSTDVQDSFGLFEANGAPKPAATAIHDLTSILADTGVDDATFTTDTLAVTINGLPATGNSMILEKSDGTFDLVIWNEPTIWDAATESQVTPPTVPVTVNLDAAYSLVKVYDPLIGAAPIETLTNASTIQLALGADPYIIETANGDPVIAAPITAMVGLGKSGSITGVSLSESGNTTGESFSVTLTDTNGKLSATGTGVSGSGSTDLTVSGSLSQLNADLATLADTDSAASPDTVTLNATDGFGNTAGAMTIAVMVNGDPLMTVPATATVGQGQATSIAGVSLSESGTTAGEDFSATLTDTNGKLSASAGGGASVSGSGTTIMTVSGSLSQVNAALKTLADTETTALPDTITLTASDSFGNVTEAKTIALMVATASGSGPDTLMATLVNIGTAAQSFAMLVGVPSGWYPGLQSSYTVSAGGTLTVDFSGTFDATSDQPTVLFYDYNAGHLDLTGLTNDGMVNPGQTLTGNAVFATDFGQPSDNVVNYGTGPDEITVKLTGVDSLTQYEVSTGVAGTSTSIDTGVLETDATGSEVQTINIFGTFTGSQTVNVAEYQGALGDLFTGGESTSDPKAAAVVESISYNGATIEPNATITGGDLSESFAISQNASIIITGSGPDELTFVLANNSDSDEMFDVALFSGTYGGPSASYILSTNCFTLGQGTSTLEVFGTFDMLSQAPTVTFYNYNSGSITLNSLTNDGFDNTGTTLTGSATYIGDFEAPSDNVVNYGTGPDEITVELTGGDGTTEFTVGVGTPGVNQILPGDLITDATGSGVQTVNIFGTFIGAQMVIIDDMEGNADTTGGSAIVDPNSSVIVESISSGSSTITPDATITAAEFTQSFTIDPPSISVPPANEDAAPLSGISNSHVADNYSNPAIELSNFLKAYENGNAKIIFMGDSTTAGVGTSSDAQLTAGSVPDEFNYWLNQDGIGSQITSVEVDNNNNFVLAADGTTEISDQTTPTDGATINSAYSVAGPTDFLSGQGSQIIFNPDDPIYANQVAVQILGSGSDPVQVAVNGTVVGAITASADNVFDNDTVDLAQGETITSVTLTQEGTGGQYIEGIETNNTSSSAIKVIDAGVSGRTALAANYQQTAGNFSADASGSVRNIIAQDPSLVFLDLGINDMDIRAATGETIPIFIAAEASIISDFQSKGISVILESPTPWTDAQGASNETALVQTIGSVAASADVPFLDLNAMFGGGSSSNIAMLRSEGFFSASAGNPHLSATGYALVAQAQANFVASLVKTSG